MPRVLTYFDHDRNGSFTRPGYAPAGAGSVTLLDERFDTWPLGTMTVTTWNQRMAGGQASGSSAELARHQVVANPDLGGRMLDLTLLAGVQGGNGGTSMVVPLREQHPECFFEVKYKLVGPNFDFGLGAKVPGLAGVKPGVAGSYPTGCKPSLTDEGWSARHMWAGHSGMPDFTGLTYLYGYDSRGANSGCGEDGWWYDPPDAGVKTAPPAVLMTPNVWHTTRTRTRVNTVGQADGIIQTWHDGVLVYSRTNRQQRVRADVLHSHLLWHWFYGGSTADWAPDTDQHIWVDYVKVWTP